MSVLVKRTAASMSRNLLKGANYVVRKFNGRRFHDDQRGLEALQVVMILAVAAVCLQLIKHWWPWWSEYLKLAIDIFVEN